MSAPTVLVVGEHHNGKIRLASLELVSAAQTIAGDLGAEVAVAVAGAGVAGIAAEFATIEGVDRVLHVEHDALAQFLPGPWVGAVSSIVQQVQPVAVLIPSSITGRDYAARAAARLDVGLVPDALSLGTDGGSLIATRAVLGGRVQTTVGFQSTPAMVTMAPGAYPRAEAGYGSAPIEKLAVEIDATDARVTLVDVTGHVQGAKALADAERVVSGGRGLGKAENFDLVEELAGLLHAAVGASGATVGAGWRSHSDQVGSTGHIVSPKLYLAVGISGAPQHLVGMSGSDYIVAINRDSDAPIFNVASYGIVGDLFEVVPALIRQLKASAE